MNERNTFEFELDYTDLDFRIEGEVDSSLAIVSLKRLLEEESEEKEEMPETVLRRICLFLFRIESVSYEYLDVLSEKYKFKSLPSRLQFIFKSESHKLIWDRETKTLRLGYKDEIFEDKPLLVEHKLKETNIFLYRLILKRIIGKEIDFIFWKPQPPS